MKIQEVLLEYGKLKLEYQKVNSKIKKITTSEYINLSENEDFIQLHKYFDYNKHREPMERFLEFEEWAEEVEEEIKPISWTLLKLIEQRSNLKIQIGYKKAWITKYAINLTKE